MNAKHCCTGHTPTSGRELPSAERCLPPRAARARLGPPRGHVTLRAPSRQRAPAATQPNHIHALVFSVQGRCSREGRRRRKRCLPQTHRSGAPDHRDVRQAGLGGTCCRHYPGLISNFESFQVLSSDSSPFGRLIEAAKLRTDQRRKALFRH